MRQQLSDIRRFCNDPNLDNLQSLSDYAKSTFLETALRVVSDHFGTQRTRTRGDFVLAHRILNVFLKVPSFAPFLKATESELFRSRRLKRRSEMDALKPLIPAKISASVRVILNPRDGDCFFQSISDAYMEIGRYISVRDLRNLLSSNASRKVFTNLRQLWKDASVDYLGKQEQRRELVSTLQLVTDSSIRKQIKQNIDWLTTQLSLIESESALDQFKWIRNIDTFQKYQDYMKTKNYWASEPDIAILERLLNIKFIIIQDPDGRGNNYRYVCNLLDEHIGDVFIPDFYVVVRWKGSHYELVQFKINEVWKGIFMFEQLPKVIKDGYIKRCLSPQSSYNKIPTFVSL
jgi:hypothetical protein